jgi:hypothetical protein
MVTGDMSNPTWIGGAALATAGAAYALLLGFVRRVDRGFPSTDPAETTWWFGYLRDLVNAAGVALFSAAYLILGFPGPLALLGGFATTLAAYGLDYLVARTLGLRRAAVALAIVLALGGIVVAAFREPAAAALDELVHALFSGATARRGGG